MVNYTGNERQESKISELGELAHHLFPKVEIRAFKGAFRFGIKAALEKKGIASWSDMVDKGTAEKRHFFDEVLKETNRHLLGHGLSDDEIRKLYKALKERNETYIR